MKKVIEIGAFQAKNQLSSLLRQVEKGQRVFITRRGERVALLIGVRDQLADIVEDASPEERLAQIREFRRTAKRGKESLKDLIEEGRR
jgi:prevent-host-death family protein